MSDKRAEHPFRFCTQLSLVELTGRRARNLSELAAHLREVSGAVIYHHTHHFLKRHQALSPEPPNDFAHWVSETLQEAELGERLAAVDTVRFPTLRALRERLLELVEARLDETGDARQAPRGDEFHFMKTRSFVIPTPYEALTLEDFGGALRRVSLDALYYHIFEARLRLERPTNDFSAWLGQELKEDVLAQAIAGLNPYAQSLEDLRGQILQAVERRLAQAPREGA